MFDRKYSYIIAAAVWGIPGINIAVKGVRAYMMIKPLTLWWLILITVAVAVFFFNIFRKVVRKYSDRIAALPDRVWIWQVFPPRGWILLMFMMGLGITLKYAPGVPMVFTASFYSGLGPMLVVAALRFLLELWHFANKNVL